MLGSEDSASGATKTPTRIQTASFLYTQQDRKGAGWGIGRLQHPLAASLLPPSHPPPSPCGPQEPLSSPRKAAGRGGLIYGRGRGGML